MSATEPLRVAFVSLGCAKNLVDSEKMLGQLAEAGCAITADERDADVIVINTCGFLAASRAEADSEIRSAVAKKQDGRVRRVVVAGCLPQRDKTSILDRIPGVDALVGVHNRDDIVRAVVGRPRPDRLDRAVDLHLSEYHPYQQVDTGRLRLTPEHYAYLRIAEGCDQKCTFCTIPSIRGPLHSKPISVIVAEARELVADGAKELILIGQDTTSYGSDLDETDGAVGLAELLRELDGLDGVHWIRLMYAYPTLLTDAMIDAVADCDHVCNYIDLPLQHIADRILKAMHRRVTRAQTEVLLDKLRRRIPGVSIRTTLIAGFPGETDAEFEELRSFIRDFGFDALGVFPYSLEPDTPAGRMGGQIADTLKHERVEALMLTQQEVAFARADARVGSRFEVLIDETGDDGRAIGRGADQAPEVDATTLVQACTAQPGSFVEVRCTGRDDYDLTAVPVSVTLPVV